MRPPFGLIRCGSTLLLCGGLLCSTTAWAQLGPCVDERPCDPRQQPPPHDPFKHQREAEADPELAAQAQRDAVRSVHARREDEWRARGVVPLQSLVPLRLPVLEVAGHLRGGGLLRKDGGSQLGPFLALRGHWFRPLVLEIGAALLGQRLAGAHQTVLTVEPAAWYSMSLGRHAHGRLGGGLLFGGTRGGGGPDTLFGGKIGFGATVRMITLPHGGYLGLSIDGGFSVVGGWAAARPVLGEPTFGLFGNAGLVVGL